MTTAPWATLRAALAGPPGDLAFRAVCALVETWPDADGPASRVTAEARDFAARALAEWPGDCRFSPFGLALAAAGGEPGPAWPLVRGLRESAGRIGYREVPIAALAQAGLVAEVTHLELNRYAWQRKIDHATALARDADRWPSLRHLRGLAPSDAGIETFLAGDLARTLESLELDLPVQPTSRSPVPGWVQPAESLRRFTVRVGRSEADFRPLLAGEHLPRLEALSLKGRFFVGPTPGWLQLVAEEPVFATVGDLHLEEWPESLVLGILTRRDLRLERLALRNRFDVPNLVAHQQDACRLTAAGVSALARGGALAGLERLSVVNERVGDVIVDLVAATTPGRLHTLELVNVGLTDAGVARLAALPHLAGVTALDLQQNPITARGVAALTASPHLGRVRHLTLGGGPAHPYYSGAEGKQDIGDTGAEALAASGLLGQLESLGLGHAAVGPRGVAALCELAPSARPVRLDLSRNPLGADGVLPLARAGWFSALRELNLSVGSLDDEAVAHLARADLGRLRDLRLAYNSIGPQGAAHLAAAPTLGGLWRLDLHDNFVGDEGLLALSRGAILGQLVELDLEQDVWNYRRAPFGVEAVRAFASSSVFRSLDSCHAGAVDEYHGSRDRLPFSPAAMELVRSSPVLRAAVRHFVAAVDAEGDPLDPEPLEFAYHYTTPRDSEESARAQDFRGIPPLEAGLSEGEWLTAEDPGWMLEFLGEASPRKLRLFACACARRALGLAGSSRLAALVDLAERFADGEVPWADCDAAGTAATAATPEHDSMEAYVLFSAANTVRPSAQEAAQCSASQGVLATVARDLAERPGSVFDGVYLPEHRAQATLLRCLFRYPALEPPGREAGWLSASVVALAEEIYRQGAFERLPELADALEAAGCADGAITAHAREAGPHARGCWVVDFVLAKV